MISIPQLMIKYILLIFFIMTIGCHGPTQETLVLFDFESDSDLDRLHWKCHTLLSLSDEHATHGKRSLKLELFPSEYPGLSPVLGMSDWQGYKSLGFDMFNSEKKDVRIIVRIDDSKDALDYADRYNHGFVLQPGLNLMNIPLDDLITSGTNRKLDLNNIRGLVLFMASPVDKVTLYVDYMRLES
jgi:hypothetical protein